jgi:hypothetical protein
MRKISTKAAAELNGISEVTFRKYYRHLIRKVGVRRNSGSTDRSSRDRLKPPERVHCQRMFTIEQFGAGRTPHLVPISLGTIDGQHIFRLHILASSSPAQHWAASAAFSQYATRHCTLMHARTTPQHFSVSMMSR